MLSFWMRAVSARDISSWVSQVRHPHRRFLGIDVFHGRYLLRDESPWTFSRLVALVVCCCAVPSLAPTPARSLMALPMTEERRVDHRLKRGLVQVLRSEIAQHRIGHAPASGMRVHWRSPTC